MRCAYALPFKYIGSGSCNRIQLHLQALPQTAAEHLVYGIDRESYTALQAPVVSAGCETP